MSEHPSLSSQSRSAQPQPVALFVSDLHLQESLPRTTQAFFDFLENHAKRARQLYLMGDVFEYWIGDDDITRPFSTRVVRALRKVSDAGVGMHWIAGNRDFLVGEGFAAATGAKLLPDPHVITVAGMPILLTHGDAQCTGDQAYMAFRATVRAPEWRQDFLAKTLAERKTIVERLRSGSREAQREKSYDIMDVDPQAISDLLGGANCTTLIHGHTHRPALHRIEVNGKTCTRHVLPDWECDSAAMRGGWIAAYSDGTLKHFNVNGDEVEL